MFARKPEAFEDIARSNDWYHSATGVFGLHDGYFFQLAVKPSGRHYLRVWIDVLSGVAQTQIRTAIENRKKELKISRYAIGSHTIEVEFKYKLFSFRITGAQTIVSFLSDLLKGLHVPANDRCQACRGDDTLGNYYFSKDDTAVRYCQRCFESHAPPMFTSSESDAETTILRKGQVERTYWEGFRGALTASVLTGLAVVAATLVIATGISGGHESWSLGLSWIIAASYSGYVFVGKGKRGEFDKWIVLGTSAFAVVMAVYAFYGLSSLFEGYNLEQTWQILLHDSEVTGRITVDIISSFVGILILWIPIYIKMERDAKAKPLQIARPALASSSPDAIVSPAVKAQRFPNDPNLSRAFSLTATESEDEKKPTDLSKSVFS